MSATVPPADAAPFAAGSISLRLYPHRGLEARAIVDELLGQAALAVEYGFDGVMTSEHHNGFAGYLPNPLQVAGWCLDAMPRGWAAACPLLLPLRPVALVAEEVAWLAARFPGRVGVGVASGALAEDFTIMGTTMDDLTPRFATALEQLAGMLGGHDAGALANDPAIAACATHPVPIVSAAMGITAVRRAARLGAGIVLDSLSTIERCRELTDAYRAAQGRGACILIRRAWVGEPPTARAEQQVDVYRSYTPSGAQQHWAGDAIAGGTDPGTVAETLAGAVRAAGADALNLRVHVGDVTAAEVREQICRLGSGVLPTLRDRLAP